LDGIEMRTADAVPATGCKPGTEREVERAMFTQILSSRGEAYGADSAHSLFDMVKLKSLRGRFEIRAGDALADARGALLSACAARPAADGVAAARPEKDVYGRILPCLPLIFGFPIVAQVQESPVPQRFLAFVPRGEKFPPWALP
jgi:hypothetical protein